MVCTYPKRKHNWQGNGGAIKFGAKLPRNHLNRELLAHILPINIILSGFDFDFVREVLSM